MKKLGDSRTYTVKNFTLAMDEIKQESPKTYAWPVKVLIAGWARHTFDPRVKSDHTINNLVESLNNWMGNARGKPILIIIENIMCKLIGKLLTRFEKSAE